MRSVIYGVIFTAFLASAGVVQSMELDRKALLCASKNIIPVYGLLFDRGKVARVQMTGYSKNNLYSEEYGLIETKIVRLATL
jgi:hypothetical protein